MAVKRDLSPVFSNYAFTSLIYVIIVTYITFDKNINFKLLWTRNIIA